VHHAGVEQRSEAREELLAGQLLVADLIWDGPARRTQGIVLNISEGGMAVQAFRPLGQGRLSAIQLSTGISPLAAGAGAVAWQGAAGLLGIRFQERLPDLHKHVLSDSKLQNFDSALPLLSLREKSGTSFDTTLHLFACSAMAMTGATGVAIAVGDSSGMECRGSVGSAPGVGAKLVPGSGLTGQSLSTGAVIICKDARNDLRVNRAVAEQMESRAILIIPIADAGNMMGLLEAFSKQKNHFNKSDVETLSPLVRVLAKAFTDESYRVAHDSPTTVTEEVRSAAGLSTAGQGARAAQLELEEEESAPSYTRVYLHSLRHSRVLPIVLGALVALLVVAIAMALSGKWPVRRAGVSGDAGSKTPDAQRLSASPVATAGIRFNPEFIHQQVGRSFEVDVLVTGVKNLWSAPMQISYDPEVLELVTVARGGMLSADQQAATLVHREDLSAGRVDVSISRPLSSPGVNGDGVVFTLEFLTKAKGTSKLRVKQSGLRDTSTLPIVAESSEATIIVSEGAKAGGEDAGRRTTPSPTGALPRASPGLRG